MSAQPPRTDGPWAPLSVDDLVGLLGDLDARWWLSGGVALEHWLGQPIREQANIDISTLPGDADAVLGAMPDGLDAWAVQDEGLVAYADVPAGADVQTIGIHDPARGAWVLQVNVEDGTPDRWLYRRDPRLGIGWDEAVLDVRGVPTGAPGIQLLWKTLRPRPQDELDREAVLPHLSEDERTRLTRDILSIHPHSTWAIHFRSPFAPAKASWNRKKG